MNPMRIATIASVLLLTSRTIGQEVEPRGSAVLNSVTVRPVLVETGGSHRIEYWSGSCQVSRATDAAPAGVELKLPGAEWTPLHFRLAAKGKCFIELGPERSGPLTFRWRLVQKTPALVERTLQVHSESPQQFTVAFPLDLSLTGEMASFSGPVTNRVLCDTVRGAERTETFPVAMVRTSGQVWGIVADSPGLWENRCQVLLDPAARQLAVLTGDGRDPYPLVIKPPEDARDTYQYPMDGWQTLAADETRQFTTWVFASRARHHYDAQLAAHLAVANAKGWNGSSVEAILRNTSLFLLRRNLARDADNQARDGRYIFVSGPGYGWKQWVTDGFYTALGLDDPEKTQGWKTYHDVLLYDEGDSPASNQGFHCGALLAAKELGLEVTDQDIDAANYLLAGVHGLPAEEVDRLLAERIGREIAQVPAFNESISTVDGHPHGHVLYSWNSGYWWLPKEICRRLGLTGEDPVERAVDAQLGVVREDGVLRLQSEK